MDLEQFVCEVLWVSMSKARVDVFERDSPVICQKFPKKARCLLLRIKIKKITAERCEHFTTRPCLTEFAEYLCDLRDRVYVEPTPLEDFIF